MIANETIAAIATPPGIGGVCIIRISGAQAHAIAVNITHKKNLVPRQAILSHFYDLSGEQIDQGIVLYFPAPHSFTGEDVVELQGHGGIAVAHALLSATLDFGARLAHAGEFTQRAFLNDKLDLAQAEAVADLIHARSQDALRAANRSLQGVFSQKIDALADELLRLRVYVEASLDFSEDEIDFLGEGKIREKLVDSLQKTQQLLAQSQQGQLLNDGIHLVLAGRPNAGKSSLLNALLGEERAIVTPQAGTTRDIVREDRIIDGIPVHLSDTAGLRESQDLVEQEGIRRSFDAVKRADIVLLLADGSARDNDARAEFVSLQEELHQLAPHAQFLVVYNKADLVDEQTAGDDLWISAKTGAGIETLLKKIATLAGKNQHEETVFIARKRHIRALESVEAHLQRALQQLEQFFVAELVAEELRLAHLALGTITGTVSSNDLLDEIFSGFCIGK